MTCSHLRPESSVRKLMTGRENGQFAMDQPLLMEAAAEPVVDGPIQTRSGWVAEEEVSNPTNNE